LIKRTFPQALGSSALIASALFLSGCPRPVRPPTAAGAKETAPAGAHVVLAAGKETAGQYGERRPFEAKGVEGKILGVLHKIAEQAGRPPPQQDVAAHRAAQLILRAVPPEGPPPSRAVEFALRSSGLVDPPPHMVIAEASASAEAGELEQLGGKLRAVLEARAFNRVGLAVESPPTRPGRRRILVALFDGRIALKPPFPRRLALAQRAMLRFEVTKTHRQIAVVTTEPDGSSTSMTPATHGDWRSVNIACRKAGRYQVEVTGEGRFGVEVLANFPVYCDRAPPTSVRFRRSVATGGQGGSNDVAALERDILARTNALRSKRRLTALQSNTQLAVVARAHSVEMSAKGFVGHVSPSTGSPADRVQRAGVVHLVVRENVARAYSTAEAMEQLMNSPAHRVNILSADVSNLGVGIAVDRSSRTPVLLVTQLFVQPGQPYNPATAKGDVLRIIRAARGAAGLKPLKVDGALDRLASRYVKTLIEDSGAPQRADAALSPALVKLGTFQQVAGVKVIVSVIDALRGAEEIKRKRYTHLGIGVGQRERKIYVFLLFGTAR
jgi:uncharacterized protein YkwD